MGIVFRNRDFDKLATKVRGIPEEIMDDVEPLMERTAETGEQLMKAFISTRGTTKSGKRGRIETGKMLDSVHSEVKRSGTTITARWGWTKDVEKYFLYQENGFRNAWSREDVEPMHALFDSFMQNRELFLGELSRKFKRVR